MCWYWSTGAPCPALPVVTAPSSAVVAMELCAVLRWPWPAGRLLAGRWALGGPRIAGGLAGCLLAAAHCCCCCDPAGSAMSYITPNVTFSGSRCTLSPTAAEHTLIGTQPPRTQSANWSESRGVVPGGLPISATQANLSCAANEPRGWRIVLTGLTITTETGEITSFSAVEAPIPDCVTRCHRPTSTAMAGRLHRAPLPTRS
jgi:hypothetical protein